MESLFSEIARRFPSAEFYVSFPFWAGFAAVACVFRGVPLKGMPRQLLLLACSTGMLLMLPRFNLSMLGLLLTIALLSYGCAQLLLNQALIPGVKSRRWVAAAGIICNVVVLAFFKYHFVQDFFGRRFWSEGGYLSLIGISYSSFKAMHFIIESFKATIPSSNLLVFLNYMLFFPSFISGPINRFNLYCENSGGGRQMKFTDDLASGLERIIHGLFKKIVLTTLIFPYTLIHMANLVEELNLWAILIGLYASALYIYADFSGYTDLAIGTARVLGIALPENFDYPFLQRNLQQLWSRWHMSLTSWITDYIYWPLAHKMRDNAFLRKHPILLSNIAIVITFLACGIWHGDTFIFVLWGLYHGLGLAVVNAYQNWKRKVRNKLARKYFTSGYSHVFGVAITFNYFAIGLFLFVLDFHQIRLLMNRMI